MFFNYGIRCEPFRSDSEQLFSGKVVCPSQVCTVFSYHWGSVECRSTVDCLWTIVFRVRKQWDYCCHILICMVKTIVCSLRFTLTTLSLCMRMSLINRAPSNFAKKCLLRLIKLFSGHFTYVATQYQNYPKR